VWLGSFKAKGMEREILEAEKLKVAGQLAAGIAHEIKNPLTSIKGFIQLMKIDDRPNKAFLEIIEQEIQRLEVISSELLVLAKPHTQTMKIHNLTKSVKEVVYLLEAEALKKSIQLKSNMDDENLMILCDSSKIKQVLINIIKNAIEAMNTPGEITIHISKHNNQATIAVTDQGCGIPDYYLEKLGKPFFSTKHTGNGLGLMICQQIISDHGGEMTVRTLVNHGTTFTITIPLVKE
jgi:signal transduction histidine kinase